MKGMIYMFRKIAFDNVAFEVTRYCNELCRHCLRGDRERRKLKTEYIDAFLDHTESIGCLTITGGEPTLAVDVIEYIYKECRRRAIPVYNVWVTTNGKKRSYKFLQIMTEFIEYSQIWDGEISGVSLSTDQFHDYLPEENLWFYRDYQYYVNTKDVGMLRTTIAEGRAAENNLTTNNRTVREYSTNLSVEITENDAMFGNQQIDIVEGMVYLNAKGDILFDCDYSFKSQELHKEFNVMSDNFVDNLLNASKVDITYYDAKGRILSENAQTA